MSAIHRSTTQSHQAVVRFGTHINDVSRKALAKAIGDFAANQQFPRFLVACFPQPDDKLSDELLVCTNWPRQFYEHYVRTGDFTQSSFVTHARESVLPIAGPDILLPHQAGDELRRIIRSRTLQREKMEFSVGLTGCDANGQRYALLLSRDDRGPECDLVPIAFGVMEIVHCFALARGATGSDKLSNREKECLAWAAAGKSSIETGLILKLSPHTVNGHVKSAVRKLDVVNRMQAIAKACRLRII